MSAAAPERGAEPAAKAEAVAKTAAKPHRGLLGRQMQAIKHQKSDPKPPPGLKAPSGGVAYTLSEEKASFKKNRFLPMYSVQGASNELSAGYDPSNELCAIPYPLKLLGHQGFFPEDIAVSITHHDLGSNLGSSDTASTACSEASFVARRPRTSAAVYDVKTLEPYRCKHDVSQAAEQQSQYTSIFALWNMPCLELDQLLNWTSETGKFWEVESGFLTEARRNAALGLGLSGCTTVVIKNIPRQCTQDQFLEMLSSHGLSGKFDFLHKPDKARRNGALLEHRDGSLEMCRIGAQEKKLRIGCCVHFAFVNFVSAGTATQFYNAYHGRFFGDSAPGDLPAEATQALGQDQTAPPMEVNTPLEILPANAQGLYHNALQYFAKARCDQSASRRCSQEPLVIAAPGYFAKAMQENLQEDLDQ